MRKCTKKLTIAILSAGPFVGSSKGCCKNQIKALAAGLKRNFTSPVRLGKPAAACPQLPMLCLFSSSLCLSTLTPTDLGFSVYKNISV
jgi:hypothetical protein